MSQTVAESNSQTIARSNKQLQDFLGHHFKAENNVNEFIKAQSPEGVADFFKREIEEKKAALDSQIKALTLSNHQDTEKAINEICREVATYTDLKMGIVRSASDEPKIAFVGNDSNDKSPVILRDARLQNYYSDRASKPDDVPEATIAVAAGNLRGILQIIQDVEGADTDKQNAKKEALEVFKYYSHRINKGVSQEERNKIVGNMNSEMLEVLEGNELLLDEKNLSEFKKNKKTMKAFLEGVGLVRDLTNINAEPHSSIVTISAPLGREGNLSKNYHVQASIPIKPLSEELDSYYANDKFLDKWKPELNPFLKQTIFKDGDKSSFIRKIRDGKHMISSQLNLPGLRNAYVEQSIILNGGTGKFEKYDRLIRSGTPAHNHGKQPGKSDFKEITSKNIAHVKDLCGSDLKIDVTSLNSPINESDIVSAVKNGMAEYKKKNPDTKVVFTNRAISVGNKAHNLNAIKDAFLGGGGDYIQYISCKSGKDRTAAAITMDILYALTKSVSDKESDLSEADLDYARQQFLHAGHGNAIAANVGATIGVNGTKISNVFAGLDFVRAATLSEQNLLNTEENQKLLKSKLSNLNKIEIIAPEYSFLALLRKADAQKKAAQEEKIALDSISDAQKKAAQKETTALDNISDAQQKAAQEETTALDNISDAQKKALQKETTALDDTSDVQQKALDIARAAFSPPQKERETREKPAPQNQRETGEEPAPKNQRETGEEPAPQNQRETGEEPAPKNQRETGEEPALQYRQRSNALRSKYKPPKRL